MKILTKIYCAVTKRLRKLFFLRFFAKQIEKYWEIRALNEQENTQCNQSRWTSLAVSKPTQQSDSVFRSCRAQIGCYNSKPTSIAN